MPEGPLFGPYRVGALIGRGGMGEVHRAVDTAKGRTVALKRLPAALADDPEFQARFRREAELTAGLREPHIVPIHDYGSIKGRPYLDMRLVEGTDLQALIGRAGRVPPQRAVGIVGQVAGALDAAHRAGLVHRDVKPSNVLLTGDDFAYLIDFGLARAVAAARVTTAGSAFGTLAAMAPERFAGDDDGDHRVDVYALGCLLFEALTGRRPFPAGDTAKIVYAHLHLAPPRVSGAVPALAAFDGVVDRALAEDPEQRFASAGDLATAARTALAAPPPGPRRDQQSPVAPVDRESGQPAPDDHRDAARPRITEPATGPSPPTPSSPPSARPTAPTAPTGERRVYLTVLVLAAAVAALVLLVGFVATRDVSPSITAGPPGPPAPSAADVRGRIAAGRYAPSVVLSPDGRRAYVVGDEVTVADTATGATLARVPVGRGAESIGVSSDGRRVVTANALDGTGSVIDAATGAVTATVAVGPTPYGLAISPDARRAWIGHDGGVSVVDL